MIERKRLLALAGSALAVAGVLFVGRRLAHYAGLADLSHLTAPAWATLAFLALAYGAANSLLALGWWFLLKRGGEKPDLVWTIRAYGTAQLAKYVPGNVFHLAGRQALGMAAGLSGPLLARSMAWELGLCAGAGACLGLLVLPMPLGLSAGAITALAAGIGLCRYELAETFGCCLLFLALAGALFALLVGMLGPGQGWIAIAGAYVLAWLAGLMVPGAPAGLGVREAVLTLLLAGHIPAAQAGEVAVLSRLMTLGGDLAFYLVCAGIGRSRLAAFGGWVFVLVIQGAVPFLAIPTLGQAVWSMGFAQSFANQGQFALHAINFGAPHPAAIAFGLAGAWPGSWLIRLGLHPADAYAAVMAMGFTAAYAGAWALARRVGAGSLRATLLAVAWLSLPIVWGHADFSLLSLGLALLPAYFLTALLLTEKIKASRVAVYGLTAVIAVFVDGYSFMMAAVAATLLFLVRRKWLALPVHAGAFGIAVGLYVAYFGGDGGEPTAPLDFFRGWGADLSFFVLPTRGMHWLLGGIERDTAHFFGDRSVWETTFCLPLLVSSLICFRRRALTPAALLIVAVGFYMALGPSFKIFAEKPMDLAVTAWPTGNGWISAHLPGFRAMRASYRWTAMGLLGAWLILAMGAQARWTAPLLGALILCSLPDLPARWAFERQQRDEFLAIDAEYIDPLRLLVHSGERVVFLPYRNDFLAGYAAARLGAVAYNIGGDKNLAVAYAHWPVPLRAIGIETVNEAAVTTMLAESRADVVVIPYVHGLWAAHLWPCLEDARPSLTGKNRENYAEIPGFYCAAEKKTEWTPLIENLRRRGDLSIADTDLFAVITRE